MRFRERCIDIEDSGFSFGCANGGHLMDRCQADEGSRLRISWTFEVPIAVSKRQLSRLSREPTVHMSQKCINNPSSG